MPVFHDIPSLQAAFDAFPSDYRLGRAFTHAELDELCDILRIEHGVRWRKSILIGAIRDHLMMMGNDLIPTPTCDIISCPFEVGKHHWYKANRGEAVTISFSNDLNKVLPGATAMMMDRYNLIGSQTKHLKFELARRGTVPDIQVVAEDSDGPGSTLGWTLSFTNPQTFDLDLHGDSQYSVKLNMDPAEPWNRPFFLTTGAHEAVHSCGIGHSDQRDSLMWPSFLGERLDLDPWTIRELTDRHLPYGAIA